MAPVIASFKPSTVAEQRRYELNAATSFFGLPPEIRNKIYRLVLGARDIHIFAMKTADGTEFQQPDWHRTHNLCVRGSHHDKVELGLRLALLRVCRQVYNEAYLIPYASNTFVFEHDSALHKLAKTLTLKQSIVIDKICITPSAYVDAGIAIPRRDRITRFGGLKHLTILGTIPSVHTRPGSIREEILRFIREVTDSLKGLNWSSVVVCFTSKRTYDKFGNLLVSDGDFRAESREMERVLLRSWKNGSHAMSDSEHGSAR